MAASQYPPESSMASIPHKLIQARRKRKASTARGDPRPYKIPASAQLLISSSLSLSLSTSGPLNNRSSASLISNVKNDPANRFFRARRIATEICNAGYNHAVASRVFDQVYHTGSYDITLVGGLAASPYFDLTRQCNSRLDRYAIESIWSWSWSRGLERHDSNYSGGLSIESEAVMCNEPISLKGRRASV